MGALARCSFESNRVQVIPAVDDQRETRMARVSMRAYGLSKVAQPLCFGAGRQDMGSGGQGVVD